VIRVAHINDDPGLGGINRSLDAQLPRLDPIFRSRRLIVSPARHLPPVLRADVVVIHFALNWGKLAWLKGLRLLNPEAAFILVEHSYTRAFEEQHVRNVRRFRMLLRLACGMMDRVVAVSNAQRDWLTEAASLRPGKVLAINPFTELRDLRRLPLPRREAGPLRLCAYGRYTAQKGFDTLIEAMRLLSPNLATLRIAGLGPEEDALRAQAKGLAHVTIEGPVKSPESLLSAVDAVVVPSRFEAFGNVGAEARAAGRPLIVSNVDGLVEQALAFRELTVPPADPAALVDAIVWLAGQDLAILADLSRRSSDGSELHTIGRWNALLAELAGTVSRAGSRPASLAGPALPLPTPRPSMTAR
jgi:glycosyltransferase involved in cell wall biosynthesis